MANLGHRATIKYITCFPGNQTHAKKINYPSLGFRRCMVHDTFGLLVLHTLFIYFISHIISSFIPMMVGFYHVVHWRPTNYPFCCHRILSPYPNAPILKHSAPRLYNGAPDSSVHHEAKKEIAPVMARTFVAKRKTLQGWWIRNVGCVKANVWDVILGFCLW